MFVNEFHNSVLEGIRIYSSENKEGNPWMADVDAITYKKGKQKPPPPLTPVRISIRKLENKNDIWSNPKTTKYTIFERENKQIIVCFKCNKTGHIAFHCHTRVYGDNRWNLKDKLEGDLSVNMVDKRDENRMKSTLALNDTGGGIPLLNTGQSAGAVQYTDYTSV